MKFINYFSLIHVEKSIISIELNRTRSKKRTQFQENFRHSEKRLTRAKNGLLWRGCVEIATRVVISIGDRTRLC